MVHLWQHHFGTPSRTSYHNKEWAAKMRAVGLIPSDTGRPGGKETGQKVSHYIEEGGPFALACADLLRHGYGVAWVENVATGDAGGEGEGGEGEGEDTGAETARKKAASKTKFTCPSCAANAWGKPDLKLICGVCEVPLEAAA